MARRAAPSQEEGILLAQRISEIDEQRRREMATFLAGGIRVRDFMPYLRACIKRILDDVPGTRVKATTRRALMDFAATWGLQTRGETRYTITPEGSFDLGGFEDLTRAAEKSGLTRAHFIRLAVAEKVARDFGTDDD